MNPLLIVIKYSNFVVTKISRLTWRNILRLALLFEKDWQGQLYIITSVTLSQKLLAKQALMLNGDMCLSS